MGANILCGLLYRISLGVVFLTPVHVFAAANEAFLQTFGEWAAKVAIPVAILIGYLSQRRPIGGWLLCYYVQLYVGISLSVLTFVQQIGLIRPSGWDSSLRYTLYLLATFPLLFARLVEVIFATRLLLDRRVSRLDEFRKALFALIVTSALTLLIDMAYFPISHRLTLDVLSVFFAIMWFAYFRQGTRRVRLVFVENNWAFSPTESDRVLTSNQKKRLIKRALMVGAGAFVLGMLAMGISLGDRKPDADLLFVGPFGFALLAAGIAWVLPVRK